jgi:hypothetical protein
MPRLVPTARRPSARLRAAGDRTRGRSTGRLDDLIASNTNHDWYAGVLLLFFGDIDGDKRPTGRGPRRIYGDRRYQCLASAITYARDLDGDGADQIWWSRGGNDSSSADKTTARVLLYYAIRRNMDLAKDRRSKWYGTRLQGRRGMALAAGT